MTIRNNRLLTGGTVMGEKKWVMLTRVSPYDAPQYAVPDVTINGKPVCPYCDAGPDEPAHLCYKKVAATMEAE